MRFVFVHGAWHHATLWAPLCAALNARGHTAIAAELPSDDVNAGYEEHLEAILEVMSDEPSVLVAHTTGALFAPLLPARATVERIVFVQPLLPSIGHSLYEQVRDQPFAPPSDEGRRYDREARSFWGDEDAAHRLLAADVPEPAFAEIFKAMRPQARKTIRETTPLTEFPDVPMSAIIYRDDADLYADKIKQSFVERTGGDVVELPGSQLGFIANPDAFIDALLQISGADK